jgi:diaminopimelate decarboxylase
VSRTEPVTDDLVASLRGRCRGKTPLTGRLEPWQVSICTDLKTLEALIEEHGSPLNLIAPEPMARNADELSAVGRSAGVDLRVFFARKANKALCLVDRARELGLGVDVASERELSQTIARGVDPTRVVVTAAVKPRSLLELALETGATVVIDNLDELDLLIDLCGRGRPEAHVALRLAADLGGDRMPTRFGLPHDELMLAAARLRTAGLNVDGIHFHLDGYAATDRVTAIGQALELVDALRERGLDPRFIDIGGGIPMSYIEASEEWERFWAEHRAALLGERDALTFGGHGLGLLAHRGEVVGEPNVYPYHQTPVRGEWLRGLLNASVRRQATTATVASAIVTRGLELRCEPGRSLLDGCGLTVARVAFTKRRTDGALLVGVEMNRTQVRSTSDDFLVDPLLLSDADDGQPAEGYLVGAYCIERELLMWRGLAFPRGVAAGDLIVFPNTAGYLMHILESASHQIPLARNLIVDDYGVRPDPIDAHPGGMLSNSCL